MGLLELMGSHRSRALQMLGLGAALWECWEGFHLESRREPALDPLRHGASGTVTRIGGLLSGPVPAALRLMTMFSGKRRSNSLRTAASLSAVAGSLLTRIAWVHAGRGSARDWKLPLEIGRASD